MSERVSPFAALTGAEKQLKWLEYQSVRLPYIQGGMEEVSAVPEPIPPASCKQNAEKTAPAKPSAQQPERPQPPPEVPRMPSRAEYQRTRHSQYDAVIARMKQAELQARVFKSMS